MTQRATLSVLCFLWPSPKELALTISQNIGVGHMEGRYQEATKDKKQFAQIHFKNKFLKLLSWLHLGLEEETGWIQIIKQLCGLDHL